MTDCRLMPAKATPEMEQAAESYWNERRFKGLSDDPRTWAGVYQAMRAVAPAVQGEPVGEAGSLPGTKGFTAAVFESKKVPEDTKLYTAPQPTERQPTRRKKPMSYPNGLDMESMPGMVEDRSGHQQTEQQPAPDVTALVEALSSLLESLCIHKPEDILGRAKGTWSVEAVEAACAVLAAWRQSNEEK